jgi:hypothetical protein
MFDKHWQQKKDVTKFENQGRMQKVSMLNNAQNIGQRMFKEPVYTAESQDTPQ